MPCSTKGKALAESPGIDIGSAEAISSHHSQRLVPRAVGSLDGFKKRIERFFGGSRKGSNQTEAAQYPAENVSIPAACSEFTSFLKERGRQVLDIALTSEVHHDIGAHRCSLREVLWGLGKCVEELPHALPVTKRLRRIVESYPLGCLPMPLRSFSSVAHLLPMVGKKRRTLAELPRLALLDGARHCSVRASPSVHEL